MSQALLVRGLSTCWNDQSSTAGSYQTQVHII